MLLLQTDLYERMLGRSPDVDRHFTQMQRRIESELLFQEDLFKFQGTLSMLLNANASSRPAATGRFLLAL